MSPSGPALRPGPAGHSAKPMMIRVLTDADAAVYWALRLEALQTDPAAFGSDYADSRDRPLAEVAARLRDERPPDRFLLGAFAGDVLVGTVRFAREHGRKVEHKAGIYGMYVTPAARGRGNGRALLVAALAHARAVPGLEQVHLTVVSTNTAARGLYLSLGFTIYGREPHALKIGDQYYDEDLLMLPLR